jgi:hypothetical protein
MALLRNLAIGAVALVGAGLGGSYVVLPGKVVKEDTITIDRPVATVFALLASSPEQAPVADGLTQTVTALDLRKTVEANVTFAGNKTAKVEYSLTPAAATAAAPGAAAAGGGTTVVIKVTQDLGLNPVQRSQGGSGAQLVPVVDALKAWADTEAKKMPTADFSDLVYEVVNLPARPFLYLEGSTTKGEGQITDGARQATAILRTVFASNNLQLSNPIAVETAWTGDTYGFNFGIPYTGQRPAVLIGVKAGETPSGTAIKVAYTGAEATIVTDVYDKIDALIASTRLTEGTNFEEFLDDPTQAGGSRNRFVYYIVTGNTEALKSIAPSATAPPAPVAPASVTPTPVPGATPAPAASETPAPAPAPAAEKK